VGGLINLLSAKLSHRRILGRVYEYYIGKFAIADSGARQFFTPGSIVRLMVEMVELSRQNI
jgi:type I restriction enzyme M protein